MLQKAASIGDRRGCQCWPKPKRAGDIRYAQSFIEDSFIARLFDVGSRTFIGSKG
jgi:hypothetical protein